MSINARAHRKRELNNELNLTPFIDLLSTMVCFLLITAVWIQIGSVEIKQGYGTEAASAPKNNFEMDLTFQSPTSANLIVKRNGRRFRRFRLRAQSFEEMKGKLDESLDAFMNPKGKSPLQISALMVTTEPSVQYGQLVETLDVFRSRSISNIGIIPVEGGG